jgi:hypothetical protein
LGTVEGDQEGVRLLLEVLHLLMLYRARVVDREKVGQVMLVPVRHLFIISLLLFNIDSDLKTILYSRFITYKKVLPAIYLEIFNE